MFSKHYFCVNHIFLSLLIKAVRDCIYYYFTFIYAINNN